MAVQEVTLRHISLIALTPQQFEVYIVYQRRAGDKYDRVYKDMSVKVDAFIAPKVAREAEVERERAIRTRTISSFRKLAENRRFFGRQQHVRRISERHHCWMAGIWKTLGRWSKSSHCWRHRRRHRRHLYRRCRRHIQQTCWRPERRRCCRPAQKRSI